ncbi:hypothetical protein [Neptuniibacter sp. QD37_11]|uniref:hypothetical protein n=1 Tax=Neptuniibacter sp. QD37_11 TaxID=3398209 RepID=UPI0039F60019
MSFTLAPKENSPHYQAYCDAQKSYLEAGDLGRNAELLNALYLMSAAVINLYSQAEREQITNTTLFTSLQKAKKLEKHAFINLCYKFNDDRIEEIIDDLPPGISDTRIIKALLLRKPSLLERFKPNTITADVVKGVYIDNTSRKTIDIKTFETAIARRKEKTIAGYLHLVSPSAKSAEYWSREITLGNVQGLNIPKRFRSTPEFMNKLEEDHPGIAEKINRIKQTPEERKAKKWLKLITDKDLGKVPSRDILQTVCNEFYVLEQANILKMPIRYITPAMIKCEIETSPQRLKFIDVEAFPLSLIPEILQADPTIFSKLEGSTPDYLSLALQAVKDDASQLLEVKIPRNHLLKSEERVQHWLKLLESIEITNETVSDFLCAQILNPLLKEFKAARRLKPRALKAIQPLLIECERLGATNLDLNAYYCDMSA